MISCMRDELVASGVRLLCNRSALSRLELANCSGRTVKRPFWMSSVSGCRCWIKN